jgi:hypothetical protein
MSFKKRMEKAIAEIRHEEREGEVEAFEDVKKPKQTFMHKLGVLTHKFVDNKKKEWKHTEERRTKVRKVYEKERFKAQIDFAKKRARLDEQRKFEKATKKPVMSALNPFASIKHEAKESSKEEFAEHAKKRKQALNDMFMPPGY